MSLRWYLGNNTNFELMSGTIQHSCKLLPKPNSYSTIPTIRAVFASILVKHSRQNSMLINHLCRANRHFTGQQIRHADKQIFIFTSPMEIMQMVKILKFKQNSRNLLSENSSGIFNNNKADKAIS